MQWITQFQWPFLLPLGFCTVLFAGGYLSDNGPYPWKHWTKEQTIGGFAIGPALAFLFTSLAMIASLVDQPYVFERWFTAIVLLAMSLHLFKNYCPGLAKGRSKEENERIEREWEAAHPLG